MLWAEAFARRWWGLLLALGVIVAVAVIVPAVTGENEKCLTTKGRELCGDEAKAWCASMEPLVSIARRARTEDARANVQQFDSVCDEFR